MTTLYVVRVFKDAKLPVRATPGSAGYDLFAANRMVIPARGRGLVPTGLVIKIPENYYGRIAPRSGLALKNGIDVGAGVIDSDYRGSVGVVLFNHSDVNFHIDAGDRIAQLIIEHIATPPVQEVDSLDDTERGTGGFGSTGS
jgi:dUTP pyrophosphatase